MSALEALNVDVILNDRLDLSSLPRKHSPPTPHPVERVIRTQNGRELHADLILLCTGQTPNTAIIKAELPDAVSSATGEVRVMRTLQIAMPAPPAPAPTLALTPAPAPISSTAALFIPPECPTPDVSATSPSPSSISSSLPSERTGEPSDAHLHAPHPHMFAIGDAADAWGAIKAGHNAYYQAEVAARNVVRLIRREMRAASSGSSRSASPLINVDDLPFWDEDEDQQSEGTQESESLSDESEDEDLERYLPGPPAIKLSVGLTKAVYQINGKVGRKDANNEDLDALLMWSFYGHDADIEETRA